MTTKRVCIVGAGISGLSAAKRLIESGIEDILILEAQNRVGGRVHTIPHGDHVLEFGAHWIHGEDGNVVYEWAEENGLIDDEVSLTQTGIGETTMIRENGEIVSQEIANAFDMAMANISEQAEVDWPTFMGSTGDYYTDKFQKVNLWGKLGKELCNWYGRFQSCVDGSDNWGESSGKGNAHYKECPGNTVVNWKNGYRSLVEHLQNEIPSSIVRLNSAVQSIEWNMRISDTSQSRIILQSGEIIKAHHVIYTPSLAVLKATSRQIFSPGLPLKKMEAIEGLGIGVVNKIYLEFHYSWWPDSCDGFSFLYNDCYEKIAITEENWEYSIIGFYQTYKQPSILCGWITGKGAMLMELASPKEVESRCMALLRKRLSGKYEISDAKSCSYSKWGTNPWTRGSYSFRNMRSETMNVWPKDLAQPLFDEHNKPLVCFAGEATHDYFFSTVHGAMETGYREAGRISDYYVNNIERTQENKQIKNYASASKL